MTQVQAHMAPAHAGQRQADAQSAVAAARFANLAVALDPVSRIYWCFMRPTGRPSFTPALLRDLADMRRSIRNLFQANAAAERTPFDYFVFASQVPGIFNLGGDLGLFADSIRRRDEAALRRYAQTAIEQVHSMHNGLEVPVITIALVQGDALGGGFESALAADVIIAERSARMGLPEILFNLFPGMGAYSFLSRRMDAQRAEKMVLSGRVYTGEELYAMGVVDVLAEDGCGHESVSEYALRNARRFGAYHALCRTRRRVSGVSRGELDDVAEIWVEAALRLQEPDLRKMLRLCGAQDRRIAAASPGVAVAAE